MCIFTITTYNKLITLRNRVENSWAQIDVQLKNRFDLIPNLVETVKGYAKHEDEVLTKVTSARASVGRATTPEEAIQANKELSSALARLLVVSENYPTLKADSHFLNLQNQLQELEKKIAFARQFYNDTVMKYNEGQQRFPANIVAKIFHFKAAPYFQADEGDRVAPKVSF